LFNDEDFEDDNEGGQGEKKSNKKDKKLTYKD